jgi:hypothetical protein
MMLGHASISFTRLDLHNADTEHSHHECQQHKTSNTSQPPLWWTTCYSRRTKDLGHARLTFRKYKARTTGRCCPFFLFSASSSPSTTSPLKRRGTSCVSPLHKTVTMTARSGVVVDTATSFKRPPSVQNVRSKNTFTFHRMPGHRSKANGQTDLRLCHTATLLTPLRIEMAKNRCPSDSIDRQHRSL